MIDISGMRATKNGRMICSVSELAIAPGERVAILGSNGSGKTTLLRVLSGLEADYEGRCIVNAPWKDCVYVHQSPYLFHGTVLFNVTYGLRQWGTKRAESERLAMRWLQRLEVGSLARDRVAHLSGGERRRVALARACVLRPKLLLLDEPLADLDKSGAECVREALAELSNSTILIASPVSLPEGLVKRSFEVCS